MEFEHNLTEERQLIDRCLKGETQTFGLLVVRYERMVRSVIRRLVNIDHEVEDLAQQTFITAYENLRNFNGSSKFSSWLCQIALNKARDHRRYWQRRQGDIDAIDINLTSDSQGPEDQCAVQKIDMQLQAALAKLKHTDREVVVLKYIHGYDYEAVGQMLGCTAQAAKVRSVRARDALKEILERMGVQL